MTQEKDYRQISCLICLIGACVIILGAVFAKVAAEDDLCDYMAALTVYPQVRLAEFIGYPEGWTDLPLDASRDLWLPINEDQGYLIRPDPERNRQWIWTYKNMEPGTSPDGSHFGSHEFCEAVLIIEAL